MPSHEIQKKVEEDDFGLQHKVLLRTQRSKGVGNDAQTNHSIITLQWQTATEG
jgi:hypothetical protein